MVWKGRCWAQFSLPGNLKARMTCGDGQVKHIADDISNKETRVTGKPRFPEVGPILCTTATGDSGIAEAKSVRENEQWGHIRICMCICLCLCLHTQLCPIDVLRSIVKNWYLLTRGQAGLRSLGLRSDRSLAIIVTTLLGQNLFSKDSLYRLRRYPHVRIIFFSQIRLLTAA